MKRRAGLGLIGAALAGPVLAQMATGRRIAVISLLGDELNFVYAGQATGSSLDRNTRRSFNDTAGSFDNFALAAAAKTIAAHLPGAVALPLGLAPSPLHQRGDKLVEGGTIGLPGALITALEQTRATQVLLMTKRRAPATVELARQLTGIGFLAGLGYYIDPSINLRTIETGHSGTGMLVPYCYVQLTLADVRTGQVLGTRNVGATRVYSVAARADVSDPWDTLTAEEKVGHLRGLLETTLAKELPPLLDKG
jgi:hypothetical protein